MKFAASSLLIFNEAVKVRIKIFRFGFLLISSWMPCGAFRTLKTELQGLILGQICGNMCGYTVVT